MSKTNLTVTLSKLSLGIAIASLSTSAFSAGLDRTGQDIRGFFNEGTYAEVDFVYLNTNVSGKDNAGNPYGITEKASEYVAGNDTGNITGDPSFLIRYGVKADINNNMAIGVFYDQPWGANVRFEDDSNFVSKESQKNIITNKNPLDSTKPLIADAIDVNPNITDPDYDNHTSTTVESETLTGLIAFKNNGLQVYGGPVVQKMQAETHLRGNAYGPLSGYEVKTAKDTDFGWAAGISYSIPEIKLNAALTYRSAIDHEALATETLPIMRNGTDNDYKALGAIHFPTYVAGQTGADPASIRETLTSTGTITTPESVNLNFQTGLSAKHQLMGTFNARWVPWSKFDIVPPYYNAFSKASYPEGLALLSYEKDQYSMDVGLAKRFTDKLAASAIVGYDSGAGKTVSSIGPVGEMWSVGGGVKYNITDEFAVTAGGKYMMLGDATATLPTGNVVGKAADNDGFAGVIKLSYQAD